MSSLTKNLLEEITRVREKSCDQCLLINKSESIRKFEDVLTIFSSYSIRLPIDINSFEWAFTLKYYSNLETKQISIQVSNHFVLFNVKTNFCFFRFSL